MNNYIAYMSGGDLNSLLYAQSALQSIADKADLFVHSGEGFFVLFMLSAITFFVMLRLLHDANARAKFFSDIADSAFEAFSAFDEDVLDYLKKNGYVRNKYGVIQPVKDWMENGSREPKRKPNKAKVAKADVSTLNLPEVKSDRLVDFVGLSSRPMTRAEACLAILHEAKEAGFDWAQSAIEQFDSDYASNGDRVDETRPLMSAVYQFSPWYGRKEGSLFWDEVVRSKQVQSFKPKTQWPA